MSVRKTDCLLPIDRYVLGILEEHLLFAGADWEIDDGSLPQTSDDAVQMIQRQIRYILRDRQSAENAGDRAVSESGTDIKR